MNENLKIGLLGVIAFTLIVNTYFLATQEDHPYVAPANADNTTTGSKAVANNQQANKDFVNNLSNPQPNNQNNPINLQPDQPKNDPKAKVANMRPTSVQFDKMEHDFGTVAQETNNKHVFSFTNTGNEPLLISDAKGSCGCTVPNYPTNPIPPGESGEIEVVFTPNKGQKDLQQKTVTITANTQPVTTQLKIKANVVPAE